MLSPVEGTWVGVVVGETECVQRPRDKREHGLLWKLQIIECG